MVMSSASEGERERAAGCVSIRHVAAVDRSGPARDGVVGERSAGQHQLNAGRRFESAVGWPDLPL